MWTHRPCRSLQRLHSIASHDVFRKHVDTLVFEGNILANVGCEHSYAAHYDLEHHKDEKPQAPPRNCTPRERRLYERNLVKFNANILKKYEYYRRVYDAQQTVIASSAYSDLVAPSILRFPKVNKIVLSTVGRCKHVLSERFLQTFAVDCAMPVDHDTKHTKCQLEHLILPRGNPLKTLQSLEVHVLSPKFFMGFQPAAKIVEAFRNLRRIDLNFRLEKDERPDLEFMGADFCYAGLSKGILRDALAAATELEDLTINFDDFGYYGSCINVKHILGDSSWPKLKELDIDCMSTSQDYLLNVMKRQRALRRVRLGFIMLDVGLWPHTVNRMQKELKLETFYAHGILEDNERMYSMHLINADFYMDDFARFTLSEALDIYICEESEEYDSEDVYNPLLDDAFADPEELREEFGPFSDDDGSDMDCD